MSTREVCRAAQQMDSLIRQAGEVDSAVAHGGPPEDAVLMSRLWFWLTIIFAFEAFVSRAAKARGITKQMFEGMKQKDCTRPDVVVRLKLLEGSGVRLELPGECWEQVIRRHYRVRNKWAHVSGIISRPDADIMRITSWDWQSQIAWVSNAGWSELRRAVENLSRQVLAAGALP